MANTIDFPRGDGITHQFLIPASSWSSGGKLFFEAKPAIDDDLTDANALISGVFTDSALAADQTINGIDYKVYNCYFPPSATNGIPSNGAESAEYLGEFQWVNSSGIPLTFPPNDPKLPVIVYFDVIRKTS